MLPDPLISPDAPITEFLPPDDRARTRTSRLIDWEMGGISLNDPTGGLLQAEWEGWYAEGALWIRQLPAGAATLVLSVAGNVTEVSLCFDANMRPHFAYVEGGVAKFYWYNTEVEASVITEYAEARSPRLCLDDKREISGATRDIILFYLRADPTSSNYANALFSRQQRDRYEVEYWMTDTNAHGLGRVGMSSGNRLQVELCKY